jgi:hypothetical protein
VARIHCVNRGEAESFVPIVLKNAVVWGSGFQRGANFQPKMENLIRDYYVDFRNDFANNSPNSVNSFLDKWRLFIELVTGVSLQNIVATPINLIMIYGVAKTCEIRCSQYLPIIENVA